MALPRWLHSSSWHLLAIWAAATLVLGLWNIVAFHQGIADRELLYLGEKALLVFHGRPPRLENLGFVAPPLPYALVLLARHPLWGAAMAGALVLTALASWLRRTQGDRAVLGLTPLLFLSPPGVALLTQAPRHALLTVSVLASFVSIRQFCAQRTTFHLFLFGLISSTIFLSAYEASLLVPLFILPVALERHGWREKLAIFATGIIPTLFMIGGWAYLNWIFLGDPWMFLVGKDAPSMPIIQEGNIFSRLGQFLWNYAPGLLPWGVVLWITLRGCSSCKWANLALLALPLVWTWVGGVLGTSAQPSAIALFWGCALMAHETDACSVQEQAQPAWALPIAVVAAWLWTWLAPFPHGAVTVRDLVLGRATPPNWMSASLQVADFLRSEPGPVLLDDARLFPVVFLEGNPRRFLLPYEYEFETALRAPALWAHFVIVDETGDDRITRAHPLARHGILPGFYLRSRFGELLIYQRAREAPPSVLEP